jgi:hypothetical protein
MNCRLLVERRLISVPVQLGIGHFLPLPDQSNLLLRPETLRPETKDQ